jgi:hypothetical protein
MVFAHAGQVWDHSDKLQSHPQQIRQMVRSTLQAHDFIRTRKNDTVKIISDWLKVDSAIAAGSHEAYISSMSPDGTVPEAFMESVVEQQKQALKVSDKGLITRVVDFTIVRKTFAELPKAR